MKIFKCVSNGNGGITPLDIVVFVEHSPYFNGSRKVCGPLKGQ